jgi:hypothetical protein
MFVIHWPQAVYLLLVVLGIGSLLTNPKYSPSDRLGTFSSIALLFVVIYLGGFFAGAGSHWPF